MSAGTPPSAPQPLVPPPYAPSMPGSPWMAQPMPGAPETRAAEIRAMGALRLAAILGIVGLLFGLVVPFALSYAEGTPNPFGAFGYAGPIQSGNNATIHLDVNAIWTLFAISSVGIVIGMVSLFLYRRAFTELRPFDHRFSTPATLAIVLVVGAIMLLGGLALVFEALVSLNGCTVSSNVTSPGTVPPCLGNVLGSLLGGAALLLIGAILALVGVIGVLIGIFRIGSRYDSTLLKVAAILYIIPLVNILGPILTLVESINLESRLRAGSLPVSSGPLTMGPPPPPVYPPPPR